ncbi:MAG: DoxX family protein [Candidatus Marinimicrobia bacterium]|nr:DoxX family protein [Candidatus Neomarinimicrobiota bacterium]
MINLNTVGRYLFTVPFALFGIMHILNGTQMAGLVPSFVPGGVVWVYLIGIALIAASVSFIMKKKVYLAGILTAALMFTFVLTLYIPGLIAGDMMAMSGLLKDLGLAGGALMLANEYKDKD